MWAARKVIRRRSIRTEATGKAARRRASYDSEGRKDRNTPPFPPLKVCAHKQRRLDNNVGNGMTLQGASQFPR